MKKVFVILLSSVLVLSMICVGAVAGDQRITGDEVAAGNPSKGVEISLSVVDSYVVTIPDDFKLLKTNDYKHHVLATAEITTITPDKNLTVSISSTNFIGSGVDKGWYLTLEGDESHKLKYGVKLGADHISGEGDLDLLASGSPIISIAHGDATVTMHFGLLDNISEALYTGIYLDTVTFNVEITENEMPHIYLNPGL